MPELRVTEEQLERLEALRAEIDAVFVDGYGHVRPRDAIDFLLDTHTPPAEARARIALDREVRDETGEIDYSALQSVARSTDGVRGSGIGAEEMYEAVLEAKVRETALGDTVELDVGLPSGEGSESEDRGEGRGTGGADGSGDPADATPRGGDVDDARPETSNGTGGADGAEETGSPSSNGGGGSQLQVMMSLLSTHDDRWRKTESGDAPYEVDLPGGGTETARTKDDVKRILFTNY